MRLDPHHDYRDSGAQWLGTIPSHWSTSRAKVLFEIRKRIAGELGHDVLSVTQQGIKIRDTNSNDGQLSMDYSKYQMVEPGDFAMNHMDLLTGYIDLSTTYGVTSPDYRVFTPRRQGISSRYFLYVFQNGYRQRIFYPFGQGASGLGRWRMPTDSFNDFVLPLPPFSEQTAIAAFLDGETAKIDALVEEQKRLVELLKQKRQTVISHAVTKGLNPNAPMKASGIEWLGEVPSHWQVGSLKRFVSFLDGRRVPLSSEERSHRGGEVPYYGASGIIDWIDDFIFEEDLVLVSEDGANLINRATPIAFIARGRYWVNNHAHILRPHDRELGFWSERIEAIDLLPFVTGSAQPKLTIDALANLQIAVPTSIEERAAIGNHVLAIQAAIDPLIDEAETGIALLQERRSALISVAVTGKIDVRRVDKVSDPVTPITKAREMVGA